MPLARCLSPLKQAKPSLAFHARVWRFNLLADLPSVLRVFQVLRFSSFSKSTHMGGPCEGE